MGTIWTYASGRTESFESSVNSKVYETKQDVLEAINKDKAVPEGAIVCIAKMRKELIRFAIDIDGILDDIASELERMAIDNDIVDTWLGGISYEAKERLKERLESVLNTWAADEEVTVNRYNILKYDKTVKDMDKSKPGRAMAAAKEIKRFCSETKCEECPFTAGAWCCLHDVPREWNGERWEWKSI